MIITLPIPEFISSVSLTVHGLSCGGDKQDGSILIVVPVIYPDDVIDQFRGYMDRIREMYESSSKDVKKE